jgi:putative colanic acid biosynthesis UDP-glucose lipid carrier transferase
MGFKPPVRNQHRIDKQTYSPGMKNSTAHTVLETAALQNADRIKTGLILYKKEVAPILSLELTSPLEKPLNLFVKRGIDLFCSAFMILFFFSWLLPIIAILIKLDSKGPVFFLQKRNKKNGGMFTCIKFRTMIVNHEADILPAYENDIRITKLGRVLRNYHFDELPQLLNVFWGDMSIIGPRPHMFSENVKYQHMFDFYTDRHRVKPGITGLAQVMGFVGSTEDSEKMKQRVQLDIFYIRHWSPALDTRIIFRTFMKMVGL